MDNFDQIIADALRSAEELKERVGDWYFDLALVVGPAIYHHMLTMTNNDHGHGLNLNQEDGLFREQYMGYRVIRARNVHDSFANPAVISSTFPDIGAFHLLAGDFLMVRGDSSLYIVDVPEIYGGEFIDTGIEVFMTGDFVIETEPVSPAASAVAPPMSRDWSNTTSMYMNDPVTSPGILPDTSFLRYVPFDMDCVCSSGPDQEEDAFQPCEAFELDAFLQSFRRTDQKEEEIGNE